MENSCRIMIVDDEFITRQGIRFMMKWETQGYEIAGEASNGKEALDMIPSLMPHIVLCDIAMPIMDGLDFIKVVHSEYPDIKIIVLSGYDNFEYVREALLSGASDYVLKPTLNPGELLKLLDKVAQQIPGLQLSKRTSSNIEALLEKFMTDNKEVPDDRIINKLSHSCYRLLAIPLRCRDSRGVDWSQVFYEKTEEFLKNAVYCKTLKFLYHKEILCVILNYEVRDENKLSDELEMFAGRLGLICEKTLMILGSCRYSLKDLKIDFMAPGFFEKESFYHKGVHLYRIEDESKKGQLPEKFDFRKFAAAVTAHKYDEAIEDFHTYIYKAAACQIPEFKLKNQMKNLLYNLIGENDEKSGELEATVSETFDAVEKADYCEDFLHIFEETMRKIKDIFHTAKEDQNVYFGEILEFIRSHYTEELTLQDIAEKFNFSYSYLSAHFNQYVHEGFSEYLNRIRIQKACGFLEDSEYTIAEVSGAVGYSDHSYFCRVFKKITGETPSSYRRERRRR